MRVAIFESKVSACFPFDIAVTYVPLNNINATVIAKRAFNADIIHVDHDDNNWSLSRMKDLEGDIVINYYIFSREDFEKIDTLYTIHSIYTCFRYVEDSLKDEAIKFLEERSDILFWMPDAQKRYLMGESITTCTCIVLNSSSVLRCPYKRKEMSTVASALEAPCQKCDYFDPYEYEAILSI